MYQNLKYLGNMLNNKEEKLFIPYYRVSTEDQGKSGLGLESQKRFVRDYCLNNGSILKEYTDVQSGKDNSRKGLLSAMEHCKTSGAILVAYDITRISRGGYSIMYQLEEQGIEFIEALAPNDSSFSKGIKFQVAKEERERISRNTKKALGEIKQKIAEGVGHVSKNGNLVTSLGSPDNLSNYSRERSIEARKEKARNNDNNKKAFALIKILKEEGGKTLKAIAEVLNENGFRTSRDCSFSAMSVKRVYETYTV